MIAARRMFATLVCLLVLTGCATSGNPQDPLEGFNRTMFKFNDTVDEAVLKPVANTYQTVTPSFIQTGVGNFFGNLGDVWTAVNNLLQGRLEHGATDVMRVAVNTVLGLGGLLDIASEAGMTKHKADFGQTLGVWGVPSGPYLVLPLIGPSTIRDTVALPLDIKADPWILYAEPVSVRNTGSALRIVDQRAALLGASNLLEEAALDKYAFVRDAWLQRRQNMIDGVPALRGQEDNWDSWESPESPGSPASPSSRPSLDPIPGNAREPEEAAAVQPETVAPRETPGQLPHSEAAGR